MDNIIEGLFTTCLYMLIIFAPLCLLTYFCEETRIGRRLADKVLRKMCLYNDDEPNIVTFRINGEDTDVDLDKMSLDQLVKLSDWIEESISKK